MICPATQQARAWAWLALHMPKDGSVHVRDVTSMFSGINIIGPHAQQLLADVSDISTARSDFRPMTCKKMDVGNASGAWAMRLTHTGEDGFILYIPSEVRRCLFGGWGESVQWMTCSLMGAVMVNNGITNVLNK